MARDIKEILEGTDPAKVAEFTAKAAGATDAAAIKVLAGEYGVELADDEAAGVFAEVQKRAQEEIAIDELDNVAGGFCDDPCVTYHC